MVIRGHSCVMELLGGMTYRVSELFPQQGGGWTCNRCGTRDLAPESPYGAGGNPWIPGMTKGHGPYGGIPVTWLKRIPPIEELETEKRMENANA